jgi:hypothetical protein
VHVSEGPVARGVRPGSGGLTIRLPLLRGTISVRFADTSRFSATDLQVIVVEATDTQGGVFRARSDEGGRWKLRVPVDQTFTVRARVLPPPGSPFPWDLAALVQAIGPLQGVRAGSQIALR